jgi:hypothetical protein
VKDRKSTSVSAPDSVDWITAIKGHQKREGDALILADLRAGDLLEIETRHTRYRLDWHGSDKMDAKLETDRPDRPHGAVRIMGCALGAGSTIAPDRLFNGGCLEFTSQNGAMVHRTTPITGIRLLRRPIG